MKQAHPVISGRMGLFCRVSVALLSIKDLLAQKTIPITMTELVYTGIGR